uniref:Uncharacterized protein n=1 Tax=Leersia perrieri TaxID=77586 RepID=A0A0D9WLT2_9ORYZ
MVDNPDEPPRKGNRQPDHHHPAPLLAVAAVAAVVSPRATLALSGGSMGGCSSSSSYSSSSSSSSSDSSSSGSSWRSSSSSFSSSWPKKEKVEYADLDATHESVGTAATLSPPMVVLSFWEKFWYSVTVVLGFVDVVLGLLFLIRIISVVKLQVALGGVAAAESFQNDLNKIAERAEGSSPRHAESETISSLRRHKDCCIASSLSIDSWNGHFKKISLEERQKFDEETLSN